MNAVTYGRRNEWRELKDWISFLFGREKQRGKGGGDGGLSENGGRRRSG